MAREQRPQRRQEQDDGLIKKTIGKKHRRVIQMTFGDKIRNSCNEELAEIIVNLCHESYTKAIEDVSTDRA